MQPLPETPAPALVQLRLVGAPGCRVGGGPWQALAAKDALLLARLCLQGRQPRSAIAAWLWPGTALPRSHANLRQRLFRLRQHAGAPVHEEADGLCLAGHVACDADLDARRSPLPDTGLGDDHQARLLEGLAVTDDSLAAWLDDARSAWAGIQLDRLVGRVAGLQARSELAAALPLCERLLALDPLREHSWRALMRLHHQRGDRAAAVAAFERCERVLRDELGLKPSPETLALLADVEALSDAPLVQRAPLPPSLLRPPRLVARRAELTRMAAAWQDRRSFVLLGDAGLGKSRLLAEFAAARPGVVLEGARPGDEGVPYGLLVRLLRRLARALPDNLAPWPGGRARDEVARLLPELGPAPAAPGLQALLQAALDETLAHAAAAGVAGVLLDDLQHADPASEAVLVRAAAAGQALRWGFACRGPGAAAGVGVGVGDAHWWASLGAGGRRAPGAVVAGRHARAAGHAGNTRAGPRHARPQAAAAVRRQSLVPARDAQASGARARPGAPTRLAVAGHGAGGHPSAPGRPVARGPCAGACRGRGGRRFQRRAGRRGAGQHADGSDRRLERTARCPGAAGPGVRPRRAA